MREILFRGKRIDNGEWVYGSLVIQSGEWLNKDEKAPDEYWIYGKRGEIYLVDPTTVGQYTCLTDRNGKKIFEGDILEHNSCGYLTRDVVVYGRWNCSCCEGVYGYALLHYTERFDFREIKWCEICGNIHDNYDLLEMRE